jgi:transcriptional regulator with XRE-family HTH domain
MKQIRRSVLITSNQLVAYNLKQLRNGRKWTQKDVGDRIAKVLGKRWSKAVVSNAERSIDGKRIAKFDADEIVALARLFEVPVDRLFTPPNYFTRGERIRIAGWKDQPEEEALSDTEYTEKIINEIEPRNAAEAERRDKLFLEVLEFFYDKLLPPHATPAEIKPFATKFAKLSKDSRAKSAKQAGNSESDKRTRTKGYEQKTRSK